MLRIRLFLIAIGLLLASSGRCQTPYWTIGPKFGWILGEGTGVFGLEVTYLPKLFEGITFDATVNTHSELTFHVGVEQASIIGLDIGPSLCLKRSTPYFGLSAIVFFGGIFIPFYEWQYYPALDDPASGTLGFYIKVPIKGPNWLPEGSFARTSQKPPARN